MSERIAEWMVGVVRHARTHWDIRGNGEGNYTEYIVRFPGIITLNGEVVYAEGCYLAEKTDEN